MAPRSVLDSSAFLAYAQQESGMSAAENAINAGACMSVVNWAEVLSVGSHGGDDPRRLAEELEREGVLHQLMILEPITPEDCIEIARLRPLTKHLGLGLGDRACLALGSRLGLPVLTADQNWLQLSLGTPVQLIR